MIALQIVINMLKSTANIIGTMGVKRKEKEKRERERWFASLIACGEMAELVMGTRRALTHG